MEKLRMCRICLAENVRMYVVVNKKLHELYERLTGNPFITKDSRPMLACFICCTKLKQCYQLQRKCLEAEQLLTQMMNEDYELDHLQCYNALIQSPVVLVNIGNECYTGSDAVKEELPAVCRRLDDVIEPEEEHQSDELELENLNNNYLEDIPAQQSESDAEYEVPLIETDTEVEEEQEVPRKKRRGSDTTHFRSGAAVAKKTKLYIIRGKKLEDVIRENQKKNEVTKATQNTQNCPSKLIPKFQEPSTNTTPRVNISNIDTTLDTNCRNYIKQRNLTKHTGILTRGARYMCGICQYSCNNKGDLIKHIRVHTGEKPYECEECQRCFSEKSNLKKHIRTHTGEKPYKCDVCQSCFSEKSHLTIHIRTHTGEKPYKCNFCQSRFSVKGHLKIHTRTHTGEKPYKCDFCKSCFSVKDRLIIHTRTHTGEKPFKCEECQRCFSRKQQLTRHIRTHSN